MSKTKLDVRGTNCPMPLIHLAKAVAGLEVGAIVEVIGDDPIFELGVREFCAARGFSVEHVEYMEVEGRDIRIELRVGATSEGS